MVTKLPPQLKLIAAFLTTKKQNHYLRNFCITLYCSYNIRPWFSPLRYCYLFISGEGNSYSVDRTTSSPSRPLTVITSPIHKHAACGDLQQLHSILKQKDVDVNEMLEDGTTPLHCAAESGQEGKQYKLIF